jgi:hypothetical protein
VPVLTIALIAAGAGWVRCYLTPLGDQAAREPPRAEETDDELPSACRQELAAMDRSPAKASHEQQQYDSGNPVRPELDLAAEGPSHDGSRGRSLNAHGSVLEAPALSPRGSDADAQPIGTLASEPNIGRARSAEWNASTVASAQPRAPRTVTLPVSVEEAAPSEALDSLKTVDVLDLMRRLRSETEAQRTAARRELLRRGFSEVDLELARQLFSPDVAARKQLAQAVPRLASVDAARWLMWLAADPQPEVRMAAITTLATTGDPRLLDRVEALARKDSDQQIQALADQIAKQRDLALHPGGANPLR